MTEAQKYVWYGKGLLLSRFISMNMKSPLFLPLLLLRYIPTGVLFDLLCLEPERPWNLMVHFRGYPSNILLPCEGEDSVRWSFINSLKEAAYIINGNFKNVMNMSQPDQVDLWRSVFNCKYLSLHDAVKILLPEFFPGSTFSNEEDARSNRNVEGEENSFEPVLSCKGENAEIKLVRIQGIEPKLQIPFSWVVQNFMNPEHLPHMCVCLRIP